MRKKKPPVKQWVPGGMQSRRDAAVEVIEPKGPTEFEIQAVIWQGLRDLGINARGEVKAVFCDRAVVRFDLAVFIAGRLVGIVEVKAGSVRRAEAWERTRQGDRYSQYGVPVRIVFGMDEAKALLVDASRGLLWPAEDASSPSVIDEHCATGWEATCHPSDAITAQD